MRLDHFNITGPMAVLEQAKAFYTDILGLTVGPRPEVPVRGYWLYAGDRAIVHLAEGEPATAVTGAYLDHIAFACDDLPGLQARLAEQSVPHRVQCFEAVNFTQIFLHDPVGIGVELNFHDQLPSELPQGTVP
jgi:catechol-2,3-dioxygenase